MKKYIVPALISLLLCLPLWHLTGKIKLSCTGIVYTNSKKATAAFLPDGNTVSFIGRKPFFLRTAPASNLAVKIQTGKKQTGFIQSLDFGYGFIPIATMQKIRIQRQTMQRGEAVVDCSFLLPKIRSIRYGIYFFGILTVFLCSLILWNLRTDILRKFRFCLTPDAFLIGMAVILLLLPGICFLFSFGQQDSETELMELMELRKINRKMPVPAAGNLKFFARLFETYLADNFPYRSKILHLYAGVFHKIHHPLTRQAVYGIRGWIFFEKNIKNYLGRQKISTDKVRQYGKYLNRIHDMLKRHRIRFLVVVIPDKESIYPEYLPRYVKIRKKQPSVFDELTSQLPACTRAEILVLDPKIFQNRNYLLYFRKDTHWNQLGSYYGFYELVKALGCQGKYRPPSKVEIQYVSRQDTDLSKMQGFYHFEKNPGVTGFDYTTRQPLNEECSIHRNPAGKSGKKAVIFHDSFFRALSHYTNDLFTEIHYVGNQGQSRLEKELLDKTNPKVDEIIRLKPDIFIYEMVDRNLYARVQK